MGNDKRPGAGYEFLEIAKQFGSNFNHRLDLVVRSQADVAQPRDVLGLLVRT
jgi:hypothetical protein